MSEMELGVVIEKYNDIHQISVLDVLKSVCIKTGQQIVLAVSLPITCIKRIRLLK